MLIDLSIVISRLAAGLSLAEKQVAAAVELLDAGNTVPFITRFRKDATGGLNETQLRAIQHRLAQLRALDEKRAAILKSLENRAQLSEELRQQVLAATTTKHLDDLYLPFKLKKTSQAQQARDLGLEPLAEAVLLRGLSAEDFEHELRQTKGPDGELLAREMVLRGVRALLGDFYASDVRLKQKLRRLVWKTGVLKCQQAVVSDTSRVPSGAGDISGAGKLGGQESGGVLDPRVQQRPHAAAGPEVESALEAVSIRAGEDGDLEEGRQGSAQGDLDGQASGGLAAQSSGELTDSQELRLSTESGGQSTAAGAGLSPSKRKRKKKKRRQDVLFKDYFQFSESLKKLPPHRVLAINRGQRSKQLRVKVEFDERALFQEMVRVLGLHDHPQRELAMEAAQELLSRSLLPAFEREVRRELTQTAEEHATLVFSTNLRSLLLQPPTRGRRVLAIDPGLKSGCTVALIDECGEYLTSDKISIVGREEKRQQAVHKLEQLVDAHRVGVIAIGNGTGCRETEGVVSQLLAKVGGPTDLRYVIVNEAGASIYSTSELGKEEFPDLEPTVRSAISIGRRLLDPLSELVKINPANIGVGLYQHDVKSKQLEESLAEIVESCVNYVGVDLNTASVDLLRYVAGLNQLTARRLIEFRQAHGPFRTREQLLLVPGIGQATFVQCAGFLRIPGGEESLDATAIHPESYEVARRLLAAIGATSADVDAWVRSHARDELWGQKLKGLDADRLADQLEVGGHLMGDLIEALSRPGRDPRESLPAPIFRQGILEVEDLVVGMPLQGQVLNVVDFGVFVDIGIGESGLVHISNLAREYVRDPHQIFSVGDVVDVWVQSIDKKLRRVSLTAIPPGEVNSPDGSASGGRSHRVSGVGQRRAENGHSVTARPKHAGRAESRGRDRGVAESTGQRPPDQRNRSGNPPNRRDDSRRGQSSRNDAGRNDAGRNDAGRGSRPWSANKRGPRRRPATAARPAPPLSPEMLEGKAPLRSFSDLYQYVNQDPTLPRNRDQS